MTVPPLGEDRAVHRGAVLVEEMCERARIGRLGNARVAAHIRHDHRHVELFGLSDVAAFDAHLLGQTGGQQPAQRFSLLLAVDNGLVQAPQAFQRPGLAGARVAGECEEQLVDHLRDRGRSGVKRCGDGLDRAALRNLLQEVLFVGGQAADTRHRVHERLDDLRIEHRAAGCDLAYRSGELVALGDAVLEQVRVAGGAVGEQRDRVLGIVVLREHDHAGAGMALAELLRGVDALPLEGRRHPDVGHEHLRRGRFGARDQLVVVAGRADDLEVGFHREQRADALAHDHVVVGEEDRDSTSFEARTHPLHSVT
jgi:hypothetical protein